MRKNFINKTLITSGMTALLIGTMLTSKTMATETKDFTKYPTDVTAPWGRVSVENGNTWNNISYVDDQNITVKVYASDDKCTVEEISFYVSLSSLTSVNISDDDWKSLKDGNTVELVLPDTTNTHQIYVAFKDYNGNTSIVSTVTHQTITYNLNGGTYNGSTADLTGVDSVRELGAPYVITTRMPKKDKVFFLGWSTDPAANVASYHAGDIIPAEMVIGDSTNATLYAVYTTEAVGYVKLSEVVEVGDYVNYPVDYSNVATDNNSYIAKYNGWRVLSIEGDTVNLVSAGVPLTYYHGSNTSTSITNLAINFLETAFTTSNEGYRLNGFDPSKTLTEVFTNEYTATYETDTPVSYPGYNTTLTGTKTAGTPKVRSLTKEDIDEIYGSTTATETSLTSEKFNYLFAIPATSNYAYTWLASAYGSRDLWDVDRNGSVSYSSNNLSDNPFGVRPVVSLKSEVLAVDKDAIGAWNITIPSYIITLYHNDGTGTTSTITVTKGEAYGELPTPTREEYNFLGWYTAAEGGEKVENGDELVTAGDHKLYAHWEEAIKLTANKPVLGKNMQAVYWQNSGDGTGETIVADHEQGVTYNYVKGDGVTDSKGSMWANAITEEDGSYWVWIPRYAYKITYYSDANKRTVSGETTSTAIIDGTKTLYGDIDILFMKDISYDEYYDEEGNIITGLPEGYKVHPAFQAMTTTADKATNSLGKWDEELTGIWVAKYIASMETSTDGITWTAATGTNELTTNAGNISTTLSRMVSKPSVICWTNINESNMYKNSIYMHSGELNSHNMKNSEWGAVAYLTQSAYGRNGNEISVNQCGGRYTGAGPGTKNNTYDYDSSTFGDQYAWNTTQGKLASTTGNIYGVYDMAGGTVECLAAYVDNGDNNLTLYGESLVNATDMKTKQVYATNKTETESETQQGNYNANSGVYGDAVYEISTSYTGSTSWNGDYSQFPYSSGPFFRRAGDYTNGDRAGVFYFRTYNGASTYYSFRPALCVLP